MRAHAAYEELIRRTREKAVLASCAELLGWDEDTYMPRGGAVNRGNQLALLAGLQHDRATHPRIAELLAELEISAVVSDPLSPAAVNIREIRRDHDRLSRLPRGLVEELARVTSLAQQEWVLARQDADFGRFRPWLEKVLILKRREAECLSGGTAAYDALLHEYEPGTSTKEVTALFEALRRELAPLVAACAGVAGPPNVAVLRRDYPVDRQRFFGETVAAALGFDFQSGRLDTTTHPFFSTIGPGDCRITTRFSAAHFSDGLFALLHEVGHGLYEQGLDAEQFGLPLGEAASLAVHESQARLWENCVGRSRFFWEHFFPKARLVFHEILADVSREDFLSAVNAVAPTFNRVQADEVTYNLHILVRFELEQALLSGDLKAADLPAAWNEAYRRHLGITPANDADGCLQDGHWGAGMIGYFPTYTLGNIFAAQLFETAAAHLGDLDGQMARGEFRGLLGWLRERVYRHGRRYAAADLIEQATGARPDHRPLVRALRQKYGASHFTGLTS